MPYVCIIAFTLCVVYDEPVDIVTVLAHAAAIQWNTDPGNRFVF
jgi:hypothetical protein